MVSLRSHYRLTVDKREIKDFHKLPSTIFFIRRTLSKMPSFNEEIEYVKTGGTENGRYG